MSESTYQIDKDIPVPEKKGNKYPWGDMEPGDSFSVGLAGTSNLRMSLTSSARYWANKNCQTAKFCTREIDGGIRIWRLV